MILHLLFDSQFADYVIDRFLPKQMHSDFVLISNTKNMVHLKRVDIVRIINPEIDLEMHQLLQEISNYKSVIFHGLFYPWQEWLLSKRPKNVKIAWQFWGAEIYGRKDIKYSFLKPISKFLSRNHDLKSSKVNYANLLPNNIFCNIDYLITSMRTEFEYVKKYLGTDIKHIPYTYYSINDTLGVLKESKVVGNNIFVGNSATIENNHIETLLKLKTLGIKDRKLIVPLSYGSPWVKNLCVKFGKVLFGKKFAPLLNFIPRDEYNAKMLDCSVMIQAHLREQAHGNIVTGLWLGMRVYLSEEGIDYKHFKSIGCKVFSIERDLNRKNKDVLMPLSEDDIIYNRNILLNFYGEDAVLRNAKELVRILNAD